jgi:hypothetical protein
MGRTPIRNSEKVLNEDKVTKGTVVFMHVVSNISGDQIARVGL